MPRFKIYAAADGQYTCEVEADNFEEAEEAARNLEWPVDWELITPELGETQLVKNLETGEEHEYG